MVVEISWQLNQQSGPIGLKNPNVSQKMKALINLF